MTMQIRMVDKVLPTEILTAIPDEEATGATEVLGRDGNVAIVGTQDGKPLFYAVLGLDEIGALAAYYVRTFVPFLGPMLAKQIFGAAQVSGVPVRVHSDTLDRARAMARTAGARVICEAKDGDGVPLALFGG